MEIAKTAEIIPLKSFAIYNSCIRMRICILKYYVYSWVYCAVVMLQGRAISPVYRFLTKCGEWIWMQMVVTLLYVPDTKSPYARTMTFRVIK